MKFINDILAFLSGVGEKSSFENLFKETKINILLYLVIVLVGFVTTVLLVIYLVLNFLILIQAVHQIDHQLIHNPQTQKLGLLHLY